MTSENYELESLRAQVATLKADIAGARRDSQRLDWIEKTVLGLGSSSFLKSVFICHDYQGRIQVDVKTELVQIADTLRAAIDAAIAATEKKPE